MKIVMLSPRKCHPEEARRRIQKHKEVLIDWILRFSQNDNEDIILVMIQIFLISLLSMSVIEEEQIKNETGLQFWTISNLQYKSV
jgi:hypothetical protein